MKISGFTVKELVSLLLGSVVVFDAGVEAFPMSVAVIMGVPVERLLELQVVEVELGAAPLGVQVRLVVAAVENVYPVPAFGMPPVAV
jgi:hypothetical protein